MRVRSNHCTCITVSLFAQPIVNQEFYSSELFSSTYPVPVCESAPGSKWAAKKFSSGVHASAENERFIAMRAANVDRRPFAGASYAPSNTFVTTGGLSPHAQSSLNSFSELETYPTEKLTTQPAAPVTAPQAMSLATLLASR